MLKAGYFDNFRQNLADFDQNFPKIWILSLGIRNSSRGA
jgi:hypothetical protein